MQIVNIAINDLKIILKDRKALLILILMPFVLISILGMAFKDIGSTGIKAFDVAVYSADKLFLGDQLSANIKDEYNFNSMGEVLINDVLQNGELKEMIIVQEVNSYSEGERLIKEGKASAFIYIPENFTKDYILNKDTQIEVLGDPTKAYTPKIVEGIVQSFTDRINGIMFGFRQLIQSIVNDKGYFQLKSINPQRIAKELSNPPEVNIIEKGVKKEDAVSGIAYYGIAMSVMFALFSGQEGAIRMLNERRNKTAFRIFISPIPFSSYFIGKLVGIILLVVLQILILIMGSSVVFGVDWGDIMAIVLITIAVAICIGSIALMVGSAAASNQSALVIYNLCIWIFSFLGGSFVPKSSLPGILQKLGELTPNGQALTAYLKIMQGVEISRWINHAIILLGIGAVFLVLAIILNKRAGEVAV